MASIVGFGALLHFGWKIGASAGRLLLAGQNAVTARVVAMLAPDSDSAVLPLVVTVALYVATGLLVSVAILVFAHSAQVVGSVIGALVLGIVMAGLAALVQSRGSRAGSAWWD
jgi:hypothetical protein